MLTNDVKASYLAKTDVALDEDVAALTSEQAEVEASILSDVRSFNTVMDDNTAKLQRVSKLSGEGIELTRIIETLAFIAKLKTFTSDERNRFAGIMTG